MGKPKGTGEKNRMEGNVGRSGSDKVKLRLMVFSLSAPWLERQELAVHCPDFTESTAALAESQLRTAVLGAPGAVPGLEEAVRIEREGQLTVDGIVPFIRAEDVVIDKPK